MVALLGRLRRSTSCPGRALPLLLLPFWIVVVLFGLGKLWIYERTPASEGRSLAQWPVSAHLAVRSTHPTLIMVAHPCCPCTRASIHELTRIMAHSPGAATAYVLFYRPRITPTHWEKTDLYDRAAAIPGVTVVWDEDGKEAARFHATTSGQTLCFDAAGRLVYNGGITSARGMEGASPGQERLCALLRGEPGKQIRYPVFGCSLLSRP
jgi:hypothetical protein